MKNKIYVGNLPINMDEAALKTACEAFGEVLDARIMIDLKSGKSRGFGFVSFYSIESAKKALSAGELMIGNQPIKLGKAQVNR